MGKNLIRGCVVFFYAWLLMVTCAQALVLRHSHQDNKELDPDLISSSVISKECSDANNYLSMDLLNKVIDVKNHPIKVEKIVEGAKVRLQVTLPPHLNECLDLEVQIGAVDKSKKNGFVVKIKNRYFEKNPMKVYEYFSTESDGDEAKAYLEMNKLNQEQRLLKCFNDGPYRNKKFQDDQGKDSMIFLPDFNYQMGGVFRSSPVELKDPEEVYAYIQSPGGADQCFKTENFNHAKQEIPLKEVSVNNTYDESCLEKCPGKIDQPLSEMTVKMVKEMEAWLKTSDKKAAQLKIKDMIDYLKDAKEFNYDLADLLSKQKINEKALVDIFHMDDKKLPQFYKTKIFKNNITKGSKIPGLIVDKANQTKVYSKGEIEVVLAYEKKYPSIKGQTWLAGVPGIESSEIFDAIMKLFNGEVKILSPEIQSTFMMNVF